MVEARAGPIEDWKPRQDRKLRQCLITPPEAGYLARFIWPRYFYPDITPVSGPDIFAQMQHACSSVGYQQCGLASLMSTLVSIIIIGLFFSGYFRGIALGLLFVLMIQNNERKDKFYKSAKLLCIRNWITKTKSSSRFASIRFCFLRNEWINCRIRILWKANLGFVETLVFGKIFNAVYNDTYNVCV